jgi:hypothetical protein
MYGTTAAAAGAIVLPRALRALDYPARPATLLAEGSSGSFSFKQASAAAVGNGSITMTLPSPGSTKGNLLVATIQGMTSDGNALGQFTPAGSGWCLAKSVSGAVGTSGSGRVEIWYYPGTADSPGCPAGLGVQGSTTVTFNATDSNANCRGALTEFAVPANSGMMAVLDACGQASGSSGGTFDLTAASGNVGNALGVAVAGDFFGSAVSGAWSGMGASGYTNIRTLGGTVVNPWGAWYDASLSGGIQSISPSFSVTGENGWAVAFAAFRGVVIRGVYLDGAEMTTMVALDPTGQQLILAGDVEGMWRTADFGNHWQLTQDGLYAAEWRCNASVAWSQTVLGEVYACVGKDASANDGGFLVSTDGGVTWSMRAPATTYTFLNFQANSTTEGVRPATERNDQDRSVGHLLAQATVDGTNYLYAATYNTGVAVSTNDGKDWAPTPPTDEGAPGTNFPGGVVPYLRALSLDPANATGLYAGAWSYPLTSPTSGGLYHTTDATVPSPTWNAVLPPSGSGWPPDYSTVSDLKVLGNNLYVTFTEYGIYLYQPSTGTWYSLNGGLNASQYYGPWTSLDGYVNGSDHVIVAACSSGDLPSGQANYSNVVQIMVNPKTGTLISTTDLTASASINTAKVPPDGQPWWHAGAVYTNWLGGKFFGNPHVLVNPQNPTNEIFVTGASGFYITTNASQGSDAQWTIAVNGVPAISSLCIATDPNAAEHYVICGDDYLFTDVSGDNSGFSATVTETGPTPPSSDPYSDPYQYESHAAVFDPRAAITVGSTTSYKSVVYLGVHNKYGSSPGENGYGEIYWSDSGYAEWYGTGFYEQVGGDAPVGLCVGISGSAYYLVASTIGAGIWASAIPSGSSDPTVPGNWSWSQVNDVACTLDSSDVHCMPVVANPAGTNLYCFDRAPSRGQTSTGIWRSTDGGQGWELIWNLSVTSGLTVTDVRSGWLAVNPHPAAGGDELWVSTSQGIYKLAGANSGTVENKALTPVNMSGSDFPYGSGSIIFTANTATLYAVSLSGSSQPSTQLLSLANGGGAGGWADADPANSFGSYVSWPGPAALTMPSSGTQTLLIANQPNLAVYATVSA